MTFIQRQFSAFLGEGDDTDPVTYPISTRIWSEQDVYPSNILKIADGLQASGRLTVLTSGPKTLALPQLYDSASRLFLVMSVTAITKVVIASPAHSTSTVLLRPGAATDQRGILTLNDRITSITISTLGAFTMIEYFCFQMPDLSIAASWQNGYQTLGVISE